MPALLLSGPYAVLHPAFTDSPVYLSVPQPVCTAVNCPPMQRCVLVRRCLDTKQMLPYLSQLCIQERFCTRCCMLMQPGCDLIGQMISEKTASLQQQHSSKTPPGVSRKLPDFSALLQSPPMACTSHDHVTVCFLSFTKQLKACVTLV